MTHRRPEEHPEPFDGGSAAKRPRWLTALGVVAVILVIAFIVVLHLTGVVGPGVH